MENSCYACGEEEPTIECINCGTTFCDAHGDMEEEICNECIKLEDEELI